MLNHEDRIVAWPVRRTRPAPLRPAGRVSDGPRPAGEQGARIIDFLEARRLRRTNPPRWDPPAAA
jgi:hypothetical protein